MTDERCRITVVGEHGQVDLAVPAHTPLAEYVPMPDENQVASTLQEVHAGPAGPSGGGPNRICVSGVRNRSDGLVPLMRPPYPPDRRFCYQCAMRLPGGADKRGSCTRTWLPQLSSAAETGRRPGLGSSPRLAPRRIRRPRSSRSGNSLGLTPTLRSGSHRIASHLQERISPELAGVPEEFLTLLMMRPASLGTYGIR